MSPAARTPLGDETIEAPGDESATQATVLCRHDAVHLRPPLSELDLEAVAKRLSGACQIQVVNAFILRFEAEGLETTLFADGRAIIKGLDDPARARSHYARWIGS